MAAAHNLYVYAITGVRYEVHSLHLGWTFGLTSDSSDTVDFSRNAWVESITHGKGRRAPKHEYLVVDVRHPKAGLVSYLFERTVAANMENKEVIIGSSSKAATVPNDTISCITPEARLLMLVDGGKSLEGRQATFQEGALLFHQLLDIALTVSKSATRYELTSAMCYWFADRVFILAARLGGAVEQASEQRGEDRPRLGELNWGHGLVSGVLDLRAPGLQELTVKLGQQHPWGVSPHVPPPTFLSSFSFFMQPCEF